MIKKLKNFENNYYKKKMLKIFKKGLIINKIHWKIIICKKLIYIKKNFFSIL